MSHNDAAEVHELQDEVEALCADLHIAEIEARRTLLISDEHHPEVGAAGCQHSLVGPEVNVTNGDAAVAQEAPFPLVVELLQDMITVAWSCHHPVKD